MIMRRNIWLSTLVAMACAGAIVTAQSSRSGNGKDVKITGCVERLTASDTATGTSGTAGTAPITFVLSNASMTPSGTTGTTGSSTPIASKYRLDTDDAKVSPHVGHKVEITGTVDEQASTTATTPPATTSTSAAEPKVKVDSVRMISSTCP